MDRSFGDELRAPSVCGINLGWRKEAALMKALAVQAYDRYQTAPELKADFTAEEDARQEEENEKIYRSAVADMGKGNYKEAKEKFESIRLWKDSEGKIAVCENKMLSASSGGSVSALLDRAFLSLEDGEWEKADGFCEQVLNQDPRNAGAYLAKLMAELKVSRPEDLPACSELFEGSRSYAKAVRFGDDRIRGILDGSVSPGEVDILSSSPAAGSPKKKKKGPLYALIAVLAIGALCLAAFFILRNDGSPSGAYEKALMLYNVGKYEEAKEAFEALGDYEDSAERVELCETAMIEANQEEYYQEAKKTHGHGRLRRSDSRVRGAR